MGCPLKAELEFELCPVLEPPGAAACEESVPEVEFVPVVEFAVVWFELFCAFEFAPKPLFELPNPEEDCANMPELFTPELPEFPKFEPPNADPPKEVPLDPEAFNPEVAPTGVAPGMTPPPKVPESFNPDPRSAAA